MNWRMQCSLYKPQVSARPSFMHALKHTLQSTLSCIHIGYSRDNVRMYIHLYTALINTVQVAIQLYIHSYVDNFNSEIYLLIKQNT